MRHSKVPQNNAGPNDLQGYAALQGGAAIVDRPERRIFRLAGRDPVGMLNAILTNDLPTQGDRGVYAMLLDPKGRVQTDLRVVRVEDEILVDTEPEGAQAAEEILGRYAPFSRVELEELPDWEILGFYGPDAKSISAVALGLAEHESKEVENNGMRLLTVGVATPVAGLDHLGPAEAVRTIRERLIERGAVS